MENLTNKQSQLYQVLQSMKDENGICYLSIHDYDLYPKTPESINPALKDFQILLDNNLITSYERISSRGVKVQISQI